MGKASKRVNGKHGENMWVTDDELCFRTGGKVRKMSLAALGYLAIDNNEDARNIVTNSDLVPYGAWTEEMPSAGGKSLFVVARDAKSCWVMEINKNQNPNATSFVQGVREQANLDEDKKGDGKVIPGRAIDTPLGALFTVGSIACVFLAVWLLYSVQNPYLTLVVAAAGVFMFFHIK